MGLALPVVNRLYSWNDSGTSGNRSGGETNRFSKDEPGISCRGVPSPGCSRQTCQLSLGLTRKRGRAHPDRICCCYMPRLVPVPIPEKKSLPPSFRHDYVGNPFGGRFRGMAAAALAFFCGTGTYPTGFPGSVDPFFANCRPAYYQSLGGFVGPALSILCTPFYSGGILAGHILHYYGCGACSCTIILAEAYPPDAFMMIRQYIPVTSGSIYQQTWILIAYS